MPKEIQLTQGQTAIVCDCCYHKVKNHKWRAAWNDETQSYYAVRTSKPLFGKRTTISMHVVINETPKGFDTDHKNRNSLDNRCSNLRTATHSQNVMNQRRRSDNTSGHKGVSWNKQRGQWQAYIYLNGKSKHLGYFSNIEDAVRTRNESSLELHGEFSYDGHI